jgi:hypothetical protein
VEAQAAEDSLLAAAPGGGAGPFAAPQQPKLLQRGPRFVELSHSGLTGKGLRRPAAYACYCKPAGAGVGLSINRTACEYPGGAGCARDGICLLGLELACRCIQACGPLLRLPLWASVGPPVDSPFDRWFRNRRRSCRAPTRVPAGTGERVAVGDRLRIEGLQANAAYVFAVAGAWARGRDLPLD